MRIRINRNLVIGGDHEKLINVFIVGLLLLPIYIKFMDTLSSVLSFATSITTYIYYGGLWTVLLLALPAIVSRINRNVIIASMGVALLLTVSIILHPESKDYVLEGAVFDFIIFNPQSLFYSILFIFVGLAVSDFAHLRNLMHKGAQIGLFVSLLNYFFMMGISAAIHYDDMSTAYAICGLLCIVIVDWRKKDVIFAMMGIVCLLIAGTRGPLVCAITAYLLKIIFPENNDHKRMVNILLCVAAIMLAYTGVVFDLLLWFSKQLSKFGITNLRIVEYLQNGMLLDDSSRGDFNVILVNALMNEPIIGYGFGGDRSLIGNLYARGYYAHNLILEVLVSMGLLVGSAFILWVFYLSIRGMKAKNDNIKLVIISLFCGTIVKLMLSSSFIVSRDFFLFLGIGIAAGRTLKTRHAFRSAEQTIQKIQ